MTIMAAVLTSAVALAGEPEVFSDAGYEADRAAAIEQERVHLVYATATWCPPCQQMKKTTWVDESVESWVESHGIVTALDVDEFPGVAGELGVRAMPTMILFEGGEELGRRTGYTAAGELVAWMEAGRNGEELPQPAPLDSPPGEGADQYEGMRCHTAAELYFAGEHEKAAAEFARVWPAIVTNDRYGEPPVGNHEVIPAWLLMKDLTAQHASSADVFRAVRDKDQKKLEAGEATWETLTSWVYLSDAIGDEDTLVAWMRRIAERENGYVTLQRFEDIVSPLANSRRDFNVIAAMMENPVERVAAIFGSMKLVGFLTGDNDSIDTEFLGFVLRDPLIAALYKDDGHQTEREVIRYLEQYAGDRTDWRALFIKVAEDVGKLRNDHLAWIDAHDLRELHPDILGGIGED
ncbi:MAG: thioredoxin family protein [Planctomycetota bacterium]